MTVVKKRTVAVPHAESFPPNVVSKLKAYVYRLIDPRNGETFYVGKGRGNRVFAHIRDELSQQGDELSDKLKRIREIRLAGFEVAHVIHRHGMDDATAFEVEAALMDAYPGLTGIWPDPVSSVRLVWAPRRGRFKRRTRGHCKRRHSPRRSLDDARDRLCDGVPA